MWNYLFKFKNIVDSLIFKSFVSVESNYFRWNICLILNLISNIDSIQNKPILIKGTVLSAKLPSIDNKHKPWDLCLFSRYLHNLCSKNLTSTIPTSSSSSVCLYTDHLETRSCCMPSDSQYISIENTYKPTNHIISIF